MYKNVFAVTKIDLKIQHPKNGVITDKKSLHI